MPYNLLKIARSAMLERGLEPDFSPSALDELNRITQEGFASAKDLVDLSDLPWCSIDNEKTMDIDQITVAEKQGSDVVKILVGIADVGSAIKKDGSLDKHAQKNTTSVYTEAKIFPMLPDRLSTDLTSLSPGEVRTAQVVEMFITPAGELQRSNVYRARVKNQAKLAYAGVAQWLDGAGPLPDAARKVDGMDEQLRIQDQIAQALRKCRYLHGALEFETLEPRAIMEGEKIVGLKVEKKNRAKELIEDLMIAANVATATFLNTSGYPTLRRIVRSANRWDRIVQVAAEYGAKLPTQPDPKSLGDFLSQRRIADPERFADLSLTIVKLLGRGEYVLALPGEPLEGHFGLAVQNYTHSTAPNRRYPDLLTQRLLLSAQKGEAISYSTGELISLATHCTLQENIVEKVERQVRKCAAALFLSDRIGERYDAIITGASDKGVFARVIHPPVEGMVVRGERGLDVGDKVGVELVNVNVERGFIDFARI